MTSAPRARRRALTALGLSTVVVLGGGTLAVADTDDGPSPSPSVTGYTEEPEENLELEILDPICDGDVPYLQYDAVTEGVEPAPDAVTITFVNPTGDDYVLADQPMSGRVLWPGAEVDGAGNPVDWPGWNLVDGEWVVGDEWDWVRPSVEVVFEVNPSATRTVGYPPSSPDCATNPPGVEEPAMEVDTLTPLCVEGVTYLDYRVSLTGDPSTTVTLTWHNPDGENFVQADQPLEGRVLWPGAYPERFVELSADDGWELVNNMWQNTRDFGWAVGTVDVTFTVNPEVTIPVTFPQDTDGCIDEEVPPPGDTVAGPPGPGASTIPFLPQTGGEVLGLLAVAAGLLAAGAVIVVVVRRRRGSVGTE
ncbi:LPXTG cell wall anchor domain-containing protein [Isoptericola rhizosphaerae]|uniref:LPXTG cell wall anchor domain-containing protein n=1 Tax=Isoptericola rhizosphaerae TaxID=3377837 RepID=UPI00383A8262